MTNKYIPHDLKNEPAEERILAAATNEFANKGFYGARTQHIADAAGLNKAMLHYYFRSKENLYQKVLSSVVSTVFNQLKEIFLKETSSATRLDRIVDVYLDTFSRNPKFIYLILRDLIDGGERFKKILLKFHETDLTPFKLLDLASENSDMSPEKFLHLFVNTVSMCLFPFIIDPLLITLQKFDAGQVKKFKDERRSAIKEMLKAYFKEV